MVQKAMVKVIELVQSWAPGRKFRRAWPRSDGAPTHFKSRFTMGWLSELKTDFDFSQVWWDFSAPQHGKGPWDGLGALVKNYIRRVVRLEKKTFKEAKAVYDFLSSSESKFSSDCWSSQSKEVLERVHFMWIPQFKRAAINRPGLPGIRSHFSFGAALPGMTAMRKLSCPSLTRCCCLPVPSVFCFLL